MKNATKHPFQYETNWAITHPPAIETVMLPLFSFFLSFFLSYFVNIYIAIFLVCSRQIQPSEYRGKTRSDFNMLALKSFSHWCSVIIMLSHSIKSEITTVVFSTSTTTRWLPSPQPPSRSTTTTNIHNAGFCLFVCLLACLLVSLFVCLLLLLLLFWVVGCCCF